MLTEKVDLAALWTSQQFPEDGLTWRLYLQLHLLRAWHMLVNRYVENKWMSEAYRILSVISMLLICIKYSISAVWVQVGQDDVKLFPVSFSPPLQKNILLSICLNHNSHTLPHWKPEILYLKQILEITSISQNENKIWGQGKISRGKKSRMRRNYETTYKKRKLGAK